MPILLWLMTGHTKSKNLRRTTSALTKYYSNSRPLGRANLDFEIGRADIFAPGLIPEEVSDLGETTFQSNLIANGLRGYPHAK